jgi:hypothetical protein
MKRHPTFHQFIAASLLLLGGSSLFAQTTVTAAQPSSNAELTVMAQEDQRVRVGSPLTEAERAAITRTDADRRTETKKIIAANQLVTAVDYRNAALIMQHGQQSDDYLLAHTLAVIGAAKGDKICIWLSAAALDRYLISIKQPQIYGTQYNHFDQTKPWTQAPYSSDLITDNLRRAYNIPSLADQQKQLDTYNTPSAGKAAK